MSLDHQDLEFLQVLQRLVPNIRPSVHQIPLINQALGFGLWAC
jgi:hypothetical protein